MDVYKSPKYISPDNTYVLEQLVHRCMSYDSYLETLRKTKADFRKEQQTELWKKTTIFHHRLISSAFVNTLLHSHLLYRLQNQIKQGHQITP